MTEDTKKRNWAKWGLAGIVVVGLVANAGGDDAPAPAPTTTTTSAPTTTMAAPPITAATPDQARDALGDLGLDGSTPRQIPAEDLVLVFVTYQGHDISGHEDDIIEAAYDLCEAGAESTFYAGAILEGYEQQLMVDIATVAFKELCPGEWEPWTAIILSHS